MILWTRGSTRGDIGLAARLDQHGAARVAELVRARRDRLESGSPPVSSTSGVQCERAREHLARAMRVPP
jgi:hypothetical protein